MGLPDYLGWNWKSKAGIPIVCIPGCPAQPDNMTETLIYLVLHLGGHGADARARRRAAAEVAVRAHGARGLQPRRLLRAGRLRDRVRRRPPLPRQARLQGPGGQVQRAAPRLAVNGIGGCPNVGGICMACTMPGFPDKYMPFMDEDPRAGAGVEPRARSPTARSCATSATATSRTSTTRSRSGGKPGRAHDRLRQALVEGSRRWRPSRHRQRARRSSSRRCRGTRSPASSGASGSTRRSTSRTRRSSSATRPR